MRKDIKSKRGPLAFRLLAKALAWGPIRDRITAYAMKRPYFTIYGMKDQSVYMRRGWLIPFWALHQIPYVEKEGDRHIAANYFVPKPWWPFRWRVHQILRPDYDRNFHNHPTAYRTFILDGYYYETVPCEDPAKRADPDQGYIDFHGTGMTASAPLSHYHLISHVSHEAVRYRVQDVTPFDGVWTLFCMSNRNRQIWGFMDAAGRFVPSKDYFKSQFNKEEPDRGDN